MSYNPYSIDRRSRRGKSSPKGRHETLRRREVRAVKYAQTEVTF